MWQELIFDIVKQEINVRLVRRSRPTPFARAALFAATERRARFDKDSMGNQKGQRFQRATWPRRQEIKTRHLYRVRHQSADALINNHTGKSKFEPHSGDNPMLMLVFLHGMQKKLRAMNVGRRLPARGRPI